jgi:hypothetical protein
MNFTTVWIAINVLMALAAAFFVLYADNKKTLGKHRRLLELIPSGLSTWVETGFRHATIMKETTTIPGRKIR